LCYYKGFALHVDSKADKTWLPFPLQENKAKKKSVWIAVHSTVDDCLIHPPRLWEQQTLTQSYMGLETQLKINTTLSVCNFSIFKGPNREPFPYSAKRKPPNDWKAANELCILQMKPFCTATLFIRYFTRPRMRNRVKETLKWLSDYYYYLMQNVSDLCIFLWKIMNKRTKSNIFLFNRSQNLKKTLKIIFKKSYRSPI